MSESDCQKNEARENRFAHLRLYELGGIEKKIAAGEYVEEQELAEALRRYGPHPIPEPVLDYLCRTLEGKVKKPRGRKKLSEFQRRQINMIIGGLYRLRYGYLEQRKRRYGHHAGWTKMEKPPAEIAARLVARYFWYGEHSWRTVQNMASSRK